MKDEDPRTVPELFAAALCPPEGDYEDDAAWTAVGALRRRGTQGVFEFGSLDYRSDDPKARARSRT